MGSHTFKGSRALHMLAWASALLLTLAALGWLWQSQHTRQGRVSQGVFLSGTWQAQERQNPTAPISANLGGVPVRIPPEFAHLVEFEGEPGLLEPHQGAKVQPTFGSRIRSFGFDVRYPDMQGVSPATQAARAEAPIETSMWLRVTLTAAERYYGADFLEQKAQELHQPKAWKYPLLQLAEPVHGLTAHASQGGDANDFRHKTLYTHRDAVGRVDTFIECHDGTYPSTPCTLYADLGPTMKATLSIQFRKGLLPSWQGMQAAVVGLVRAFGIDGDRILLSARSRFHRAPGPGQGAFPRHSATRPNLRCRSLA